MTDPKKIIITGASSGIGAALKRLYLMRGESVLDLSRHSGFDVGKWPCWEKLCQDGTRGDLLFLNAGVQSFDDSGEFMMAQEIAETDLLGVYRPLHLLPSLLSIGGCCVVTASSCAGTTNTDFPLYTAIKTGLTNLVQSYARKYAGRYRVFAVSPGLTASNIGGSKGKVPKRLINRVPLGRAASCEEMAAYMARLVDMEYLNGVTVRIDGGEQT